MTDRTFMLVPHLSTFIAGNKHGQCSDPGFHGGMMVKPISLHPLSFPKPLPSACVIFRCQISLVIKFNSVTTSSVSRLFGEVVLRHVLSEERYRSFVRAVNWRTVDQQRLKKCVYNKLARQNTTNNVQQPQTRT